MPEIKTCPKCGTKLPDNAPSGICPKCLMQAGLESEQDAGSAPELKPTTLTSGFVPPEPKDLAKHFPQLEILELLGKGGMGAVYKARQPGLDRLVAIKILPPEFGADPAFAERFTREARALAKLSHQNIVHIYDFGRNDEFFYFIMEYVDGANLRHVIETGEIKPEETLAIIPQICKALQFAHDEGIVHRDIKPENILVDKQGRVKIADFGLAKLLGKAQDEFTLTGTHQVMGTLRYMAPEQMRGSRSVDHRADIYSLGVVFYEMLTGELPMGRFEPPSKKVEVDVRLDEVVLRSLESEPDRRYQNARDVKKDVESISDFGVQTTKDYSAVGATRDVSVQGTSSKVWPVGTLLAACVVFMASFMSWGIIEGSSELGLNVTGWNSNLSWRGIALPNWTVSIAAIMIALLAVLRTVGLYAPVYSISLLAIYGMLHAGAACVTSMQLPSGDGKHRSRNPAMTSDRFVARTIRG